MNNILDHFATAYFDLYMKNDVGTRKSYCFEGRKGFKRGQDAGITIDIRRRPSQLDASDSRVCDRVFVRHRLQQG